MKKIILFIFSFFIYVFSGCNSSYDGDARNSIPYTDSSSFVSTSKISFPKNTDALHIYNCLLEKFGEGNHLVTAVYSRTETVTLNGTSYSNTITKNIVSIKIYKERTPASNKFIVDFVTDTSNILRYFYQWQYHNTNAWNNNKTDGTIIISF